MVRLWVQNSLDLWITYPKKKNSLIALLELDGLKSITMGGIRFIY